MLHIFPLYFVKENNLIKMNNCYDLSSSTRWQSFVSIRHLMLRTFFDNIDIGPRQKQGGKHTKQERKP